MREWLQLIVLNMSAQLSDLQLTDPILLLLFLQRLFQVVHTILSILDQPVHLTDFGSVLILLL